MRYCASFHAKGLQSYHVSRDVISKTGQMRQNFFRHNSRLALKSCKNVLPNTKVLDLSVKREWPELEITYLVH